MTLSGMASAMDSVFLLWHVHQIEGTDEEKFIGVYQTEEDARAAIARLKDKLGFRQTPEKFFYERYQLNQDHWTEGYSEVD